MRASCFILIYLCLLSSISISQTTFQKTFGEIDKDRATHIEKTSDGGYIITGATHGYGSSTGNAFLTKIDVNGNEIWTKSYGYSNWDHGNYVIEDKDGNYVLIGTTSSFGAGDYDIFLMKTDVNGNVLMYKTYGGPDRENGVSLHLAEDGGYLLCGNTKSYGAGQYDMYVLKVDSDGIVEWVRTYGGDSFDHANTIIQNRDRTSMVLGVTSSYGAGNNDIYLLKIDSVGQVIWSKTYGDSLNDEGIRMIRLTNGDYILNGQTKSFGPDCGGGNTACYNALFMRINSHGDVLWSSVVGGDQGDETVGNLVNSSSGSVYSTGTTETFGNGGRDIALYKIQRSTGDLKWMRAYGGSDEDAGYGLTSSHNSEMIMAGYTKSFSSSRDGYLIQTNMNGSSHCNQKKTKPLAIKVPLQVDSGATVKTGLISMSHVEVPLNMPFVWDTLCFRTNSTNVQHQKMSTDDFYDDQAVLSMEIYPNPSTDKIYVRSGSVSNEENAIYATNTMGQYFQVAYIKNSENESVADISTLPSGTYFLHVKSANDVKTVLFVKE